MNSLLKRLLALARLRREERAGVCLVCHRDVTRSEACLRLHAGLVHTSCATYSMRRRGGGPLRARLG